MAHVSRPLIALLVATVAFFALWVVALKPSGSSTHNGTGSGQGLGQYQSDINAAHQAVKTANGASARAGAGPTAAATAPGNTQAPVHSASVATTAKTTVTPARARPPSITHARAPVSRFAAVQRALRSHKVLALLFYNPAAPDDRAVRQELGTVTAHGGKVFKLAIPLNEINRYAAITDRVPVNLSPTLVLVAPSGQADEIVGYSDPFEIAQRVDDALALK
jgi:hypothetical protein